MKNGLSRAEANHAPRAVVDVLLQLQVGRLVLELIPLALEVLFEEVEVADQAELAGQLEVVGQQLPMLGQDAAAKISCRRDQVRRSKPRLSSPWSWMPQTSTNPLVLSGTPNSVWRS